MCVKLFMSWLFDKKKMLYNLKTEFNLSMKPKQELNHFKHG